MAKKSKMDRGLDSLFFDNSIDEVTRSDSESVKNDDGDNGIFTVRISLIEPDKNPVSYTHLTLPTNSRV